MSFEYISPTCFFTNNNYKQLLPDASLHASLVSISEATTDNRLKKYLNYVRVIKAHKFQAWHNIHYSDRRDDPSSWRFTFPTSGYTVCVRELWGTQNQ
jgi:hypothetical protein